LETLKGRKVTEMEFQVWNWYFFSWLNGDPILEQPIHNLDVCCWAKNDYPIRANGMGGRQVRTGKEYGNVFDHNAIEYEFKDGARMFVEGRQIGGCWNFIGETLHGTKGNAELGTGRKTIRGVTEWVYVPSGKPVDPYQQEHDDFYAAIRNDKPYSEVEYAAKTTLTGIIGRMCTYGGKQVTWEEAFNSKLELGPKVFSWDAEPPIKPGPDGFYPISIPGKSAVL
jgi:myo-inositol 2-dehydrogenase/D-chiro-inositol 1-dehydrogenase